jgi:nucleotide-binding universal stress UspA family protein
MKMSRIVVGLDGSAESAWALDWAADLAALTGAEIVAVTVFDATHFMGSGMLPVYLPDFDQLRADCRKDVISWCEPLRARGVRHHSIVREGGPAEEILEESSVTPTDLIVVGSRGRGGFRELLLGSVAHHVTQHATCPVAVLPRAAARAATETSAAPSAGAVSPPASRPQ